MACHYRELGKKFYFYSCMNKIHLILEQRYTISAMYKQGCTQKIIAQAIGKDKSVVSRELKRNANLKGKYSFEYAQDMAQMRKERMKTPQEIFFLNLQKKLHSAVESAPLIQR